MTEPTPPPEAAPPAEPPVAETQQSDPEFLDKEQAQKLVNRMQEYGAITAVQNAEIMKDVETKFVDGKVPVEVLRVMIEEKGGKEKCQQAATSSSAAAATAAAGQASAGPKAASTSKQVAPSSTKQAAKKPGFYNTNVKKTREFDFRMTGKKATGMACGPSHQVVQHQFVLPSDHPAAAPMIMEEVATVMVAKLLEKGVTLKLDNRMEQSVRSMVAPAAGSKLAKPTAGEPQTENVARYDQLIATLEKDPNVKTDPQKRKALEALQEAKKTNKPLKLEELTEIVDICAAINFIDKVQAQKLVNRMQEVGAITAEQNAEIMKEVETKFVDGKVPVEVLRVMIEERGGKKK